MSDPDKFMPSDEESEKKFVEFICEMEYGFQLMDLVSKEVPEVFADLIMYLAGEIQMEKDVADQEEVDRLISQAGAFTIDCIGGNA